MHKNSPKLYNYANSARLDRWRAGMRFYAVPTDKDL